MFLLFVEVPALKADLPTLFKEYLQMWQRQTCQCKLSVTLRAKTLDTNWSALHFIEYVSNVVLGEDFSIIQGFYSTNHVYSETLKSATGS